LQEEIGSEIKTVMENRDYSPGLWHSFWYGKLSDGLEGALALHKRVEKKVQATFGAQTKVSLKRGCTEMEIRKGPSEDWKYSEGDAMLEGLLDDFLVVEPIMTQQSKIMQAHVYRNWIREAFSRGDPTVWEFADGRSFFRPSTTYHDGTNMSKEEVPELYETHPSKWSKEEEEDGASRILRLSKN